jgi:hypothetical protein
MPDKDSVYYELKKLNSKTDVLNKEITEVKQSLDSVKSYTNYQMMLTDRTMEVKHHDTNPTIGYTLVCLPLLVFIVWVAGKFLKHKKDKDVLKINGVHAYNWTWVGIWVICAVSFTVGLVNLGLIHFPYNGFTVSHLDLVLAIASIIAVIGAIWAVYARIDAERAFKKSEETLDAFGANFGFYEILNLNRAGGIIDRISSDNTKVSLFLGFPIIGYLYENKSIISLQLIEKRFDELIFNINRLIDRLRIHCDSTIQVELKELQNKYGKDNALNLQKDYPENISFYVAVFSKTESEALLTEYYEKQKKNGSEIENAEQVRIKQKLDDFYATLDELEKVKTCYPSDKGEIKVLNKSKDDNSGLFMGRNENLRFASINLIDTKLKDYERQKSMIWIVNDLNKDNPDFDSSVFQTSDQNLYKVLQTVFPQA